MIIAMGAAHASAAQTREHIRIISTQAQHSLTRTIGESFAGAHRYPHPVIESSGPGTAAQRFCAGVGDHHPDVIAMPRSLTARELARCDENAVGRVTEIKIGYEGVVLASQAGAPRVDVTKAQLFLALAERVPVDGVLIANPYRRWNEIDPALPNKAIRVYGPPMMSDLRDALVGLIMAHGCRAFETVDMLPAAERSQICTTLRADGAYLSVPRTFNDALNRLAGDADALAILPHSVVERSHGAVVANAIEGVRPNTRTISRGTYPVICPLFVYVKEAQTDAIPGLAEFVDEHTSEWALGPASYLSGMGLVPLSSGERAAQRSHIAAASVAATYAH
jgi:phosphate transport system substrate-binding protein